MASVYDRSSVLRIPKTRYEYNSKEAQRENIISLDMNGVRGVWLRNNTNAGYPFIQQLTINILQPRVPKAHLQPPQLTYNAFLLGEGN